MTDAELCICGSELGPECYECRDCGAMVCPNCVVMTGEGNRCTTCQEKVENDG